MNSGSHLLAGGVSCPARQTGAVARRVLDRAVEARVVAVFRSAFYLQSGAGLICVASEALEPGPLTVVCAAEAGLDWRASGVRVGQRAAISRDAIRVGPGVHVPLTGATDWSSEPRGGTPDPVILAAGLAELRDAFRRAAVREGLGGAIIGDIGPDATSRDCRAASTHLIGARGWLEQVFDGESARQMEAPGWVSGLAGLGPGLTPSGDDLLGGIMIALRRLGRERACRALWERLRPCAEGAGNAISSALLRAAAEGLGSASLHRTLEAVVRGDAAAIGDGAAALGRTGHSSGWDAMAGVAMVLEACA